MAGSRGNKPKKPDTPMKDKLSRDKLEEDTFDLVNTYKAQKAEIQRLRNALDELSDPPTYSETNFSIMVDKARKALKSPYVEQGDFAPFLNRFQQLTGDENEAALRQVIESLREQLALANGECESMASLAKKYIDKLAEVERERDKLRAVSEIVLKAVVRNGPYWFTAGGQYYEAEVPVEICQALVAALEGS